MTEVILGSKLSGMQKLQFIQIMTNIRKEIYNRSVSTNEHIISSTTGDISSTS